MAILRQAEKVDAWLREAKSGARMVYFVGYLPKASEEARGLGDYVWGLYQSNKVTLTQARLEPELYAYYVVKNKRGNGVQLRETNHRGDLVIA